MKNVVNQYYQSALVLAGLLAFQLLALPTYSESVPGYENSGIQTLRLLVQAHSLILNGSEIVKTNPATGNPIPGDTQTWNEIWMDVSGNRTVQQIFTRDQKPDAAAKPESVLFQIQKKTTSINYSRKMVALAELNPNTMDSASIVYAGRIHLGNNLAHIIQEASAAGTLQAKGSSWELTVGAPYFTPPMHKNPIRLAIDSLLHPVQLDESSRLFTFEWTKKEPEGFWYVNHTIMESKNDRNPLKLQFEQWVREIEINPAIPKSTFDVSYPSDYQVHDLSKRLQSPLK